MRVTVSGLPGSGTTTLARHLAEDHGLTLISAGEVFRQMARERGMDLATFGELAREDPAIDKGIDLRQQEIARNQDNVILEGRLSGWMVPEADLKLWLTAPLPCRVRRIFARDEVRDEATACMVTQDRERCEAERYRAYYGIDISDLSPYDIVLNSERWGPEELTSLVGAALALTRAAHRRCEGGSAGGPG